MLSALSAACSITLPMFSVASPEPEPAVLTTGSLATPAAIPPGASAFAARSTPGKPTSGTRNILADHLGPEDLRRANGALALALDPQGNGLPVAWDNAESKSSGRFTPVGGPYLKDDEVCRAFLTSLTTVMDRQSLQGTACRPSGGDWAISEMKAWKQG